MKKTLITLAMTASVVVSGTAMAETWIKNGDGGLFSLSGTLTPVNNDTPWVVKTGDTVTNLEGLIAKGEISTAVIVRSPIPVLGIRNKDEFFRGRQGIMPQIDYGTAVDIDKFQNSRAPVTLDVKDKNDRKIGTLTTTLTAGATSNWLNVKNSAGNGRALSCFAPPGNAFYGGLPKYKEQTDVNVFSRVREIIPDVQPFFIPQDIKTAYDKLETGELVYEEVNYQAYYGSGIAVDEKINITLDAPAQGDDVIEWKASLPVTVYYR